MGVATPPAVTVDTWDGAMLLAALSRAADAITTHRDRINALNVFPVPDGDTGTNLSLTLQAAVSEAKSSCGSSSSVAVVADRIAYGALLGARGNSGVILSQILRGFANALSNDQRLDGIALARALGGARDAAYGAVLQPVEGTMLTVIRVAAEHAERASRDSASLGPVLEAAITGACEALADTPNLLAILRQAGVVDAGGQGVLMLLEALRSVTDGSLVTSFTLAVAPPDLFSNVQPAGDGHGDGYGYCTNFMIFGSGMPFDELRSTLAAMGASAVIVGDAETIKVHLHTEDPGAALGYAVRWGQLEQIKIDNMSAQTRKLAAEESTITSDSAEEATGVGVVAVVSGLRLVEVFRSLGVATVVHGGQSMNPSVSELLAAVAAAPEPEVILLPNNGNILMAARQVISLADKPVQIVPSRSLPHGLAALAGFDPGRELDDLTAAMSEAMEGVRSIEVTTAERDAVIDGVAAKRGQVIGLVDDRLVVAGTDVLDVALAALEAAGAESAELVSAFLGADAEPALGPALHAAISADFPHLEVEVLNGGQPHYPLIMAVE